ncbi:uncharacterized protein LOC123294230 [Chrysoperla carnea]|uniref:uncharacterized protein LOC123294230 n=1 Tax=Chrysoperla carnea TaxID=189513 RepID=UPI001D06740D|nr:uncharacterized protein LOC123294230 [Chrysoperla carnea]
MSTVICLGFTTQIYGRPIGYHNILKRWGAGYQQIIKKHCHINKSNNKGTPEQIRLGEFQGSSSGETGTNNTGVNNGFFKVSDFVNALEKDPNWKKMQRMYENEIKKSAQNIKFNKNNNNGDLKQRKYCTSTQKWNVHRMLHTTNVLKDIQRYYNKLVYSNLTQPSNWTNSYQLWRVLNQTVERTKASDQQEIKNDSNLKHYFMWSPFLIKQKFYQTTQTIQAITKSIRQNLRNNINRRILLRKLRRFEFLVKLFMQRIDRMVERFDEPRKVRLIKLLDVFVSKLKSMNCKIWRMYRVVNSMFNSVANLLIKMNKWRKQHLASDKVYNNQIVMNANRLIKRHLIQNNYYKQEIHYFSQFPGRILRQTKQIIGKTKTKYILAAPKYILKSADGTKIATKTVSNSMKMNVTSNILFKYDLTRKDSIENIFKDQSNRGSLSTSTNKGTRSPEKIRLSIENVIKNLNIVAPPTRHRTKWKSATVAASQQDLYFEKAIPFKLNVRRGETKKRVIKRKIGLMNINGKLAETTSSSVNATSAPKSSQSIQEFKFDRTTKINDSLPIKKESKVLKTAEIDSNNCSCQPLQEFKVGVNATNSCSDLNAASTECLQFQCNDELVSKVLNSSRSISQFMSATNLSTEVNIVDKIDKTNQKSLQDKDSLIKLNNDDSHKASNDSKESNVFKSNESMSDSHLKSSISKSFNSDSRMESDASKVTNNDSRMELNVSNPVNNDSCMESNFLKASQKDSIDGTASTDDSLNVFNINASKNNLSKEEPAAILKTIYMGKDFKDVKIKTSCISHIELPKDADETNWTQTQTQLADAKSQNDEKVDKIHDIRNSGMNTIQEESSRTDSKKDLDTADTVTFSSLKVFNMAAEGNNVEQLKNAGTRSSLNDDDDINSDIKYCTCKEKRNVDDDDVINSNIKYCTCKEKLEGEEALIATNSNQPTKYTIASDSNSEINTNMEKIQNKVDSFKKSTRTIINKHKESISNPIKSVESVVRASCLNASQKEFIQNNEMFQTTSKSSLKQESIINQKLPSFTPKESIDSLQKESIIKHEEFSSQSVSDNKESVTDCDIKKESLSLEENFTNDDEWDIEIRRIQLNDLNRINPNELDNYVCTVIMPQEIKSIEQLSNIITPLTNIKQINQHQYSAMIGKETKIKTNKSDIRLTTICNKNKNKKKERIEDVKVNIKINDETNILKSATMALNNKNMTLLSRQCNIQESETTKKHLENVKNAGKELEIQYLCERCKDSINYLNTLSRISTDALTILERDKLNQILASISKKCNVIITKFEPEKAEGTVPPVAHYDNINIYHQPETMSLKSHGSGRRPASFLNGNVLSKIEYKNVDLSIFEDSKTLSRTNLDAEEVEGSTDLNNLSTTNQESNGKNLVEYKNVDLIVTKYDVKGIETNQHIMTIDIVQKATDSKSCTNENEENEPNERVVDDPIYKFKENGSDKNPQHAHSQKKPSKKSKHGDHPQTHTLSNVFKKSMIDDEDQDGVTNMKSIQTDKAFLPPIGVKESRSKKHWKPKKCNKDAPASLFGFFDDILKGLASKLKQKQDSDSSPSKFDKFSQTNCDCLNDSKKGQGRFETITVEPILIDVNPRIIVNTYDRNQPSILETGQDSNDLVEIKLDNPSNHVLDTLVKMH